MHDAVLLVSQHADRPARRLPFLAVLPGAWPARPWRSACCRPSMNDTPLSHSADTPARDAPTATPIGTAYAPYALQVDVLWARITDCLERVRAQAAAVVQEYTRMSDPGWIATSRCIVDDGIAAATALRGLTPPVDGEAKFAHLSRAAGHAIEQLTAFSAALDAQAERDYARANQHLDAQDEAMHRYNAEVKLANALP